MKIVRSLKELNERIDSVCTVGSYDGVHRAHQEIINEVSERAKRHKMRSVVITFDPHPKEVVKSTRGPVNLLTTLDERINVLQKMDIEVLFIINFTYEFSRQSARDFYKKYVVDGINAKEVIVGYDHKFGRDRESGIQDVIKFGTEFGFNVHMVPPLKVDDIIVSSTKIRKLISVGDVETASKLLGWNYTLSGSVVKGDGRGGKLGFPTANIKPNNSKKLIPANGVYFVRGKTEDFTMPGMMNVGFRPTFKNNGERVLEVHFLEEVGNLYGTVIQVEFLRKLRDEKKFDSPDELILTLQNDRDVCLKLAEDLKAN